MERNIFMTYQIITAHIAEYQYTVANMVGFHRWLQNIGWGKDANYATNLFMIQNHS